MEYVHTQGFKLGQDIEIFMPVYTGSLHQLIRRARADGWGTDMGPGQMMLQILAALDYLHEGDILHRDVKPANILYRDKSFLLADFGIAKVANPLETMVGTPRYVAPEVRAGRSQTTKLDIYSLGVTLLECLAELPDEGEGEDEILQLSLNHVAPQYAPMLATNPDDRPSARLLLDKVIPSDKHLLLNTSGPSPTADRSGTNASTSPSVLSIDWTRPARHGNRVGKRTSQRQRSVLRQQRVLRRHRQ